LYHLSYSTLSGLDQSYDTVAFFELQVKSYRNATHDNMAVTLFYLSRQALSIIPKERKYARFEDL